MEWAAMVTSHTDPLTSVPALTLVPAVREEGSAPLLKAGAPAPPPQLEQECNLGCLGGHFVNYHKELEESEEMEEEEEEEMSHFLLRLEGGGLRMMRSA
jgi:polycomb group RING finger protein 6